MTSFAEIMSEQLAQSLHQDNYMTNLSPNIDEDYLFALSLQDQFNQEFQDLPQSSSSSSQQPCYDEDYLVALQLQQEEEAEALKRRAQYKDKKESIHSQDSKITLCFDNYAVRDTDLSRFEAFNHGTLPVSEDQSIEEFGASDADEYSDEEEYVDLQVSPKTLEDNPILGDAKANRKPKGRISKKEIITPHDPVIASVKHVREIERVHGSSGDFHKLNSIISAPVYNSLKEHAKKHENRRIRKGGRSDFATQDTVLDANTMVLLLKLVNREMLDEVNGVVSTGKEAHVYHATSSYEEFDCSDIALKVYKTTLNEFKQRKKYIEGDFRFKGQYKRQHNPRQIIKLWAEKEFYNLKRIHNRNINCPRPLFVKNNVLCMTFIGQGSVPASTLREASLSTASYERLYVQSLKLIRNLYQKCQLVHSDLSEFNLLYHQRQLWVIDVGQAVHFDSPNALYFLRRDCLALTTFFRRKKVANTLNVKELFDFVTDGSLFNTNESEKRSDNSERESSEEQSESELEAEEELLDAYIQDLRVQISKRDSEQDAESSSSEQVFLNCFIPRTLDEIVDYVHEQDRNEEGLVFHHPITSMRSDLRGPRK